MFEYIDHIRELPISVNPQVKMDALKKRSTLHMRCNIKIGAARLFLYCNAFALLIQRDSNTN